MAFETVVVATAVPVTTANAVVVASAAIPQQVDAPYGFVIEGYVNYTTAASATAVALQVRQGALVGGTQVGTTDTVTVAATTSYNLPFCQEFPSNVPPYGNQFCLCAQGTTAGGTINNVVLKVRAVNPQGN